MEVFRRSCEKCDFICNCEVKDANSCPFDDPKVYLGEPVQPRVSHNLWHPCSYVHGELIHDGTWEDGKWYEWKDIFGNVEKARMKLDTPDHFFPPTGVIKEEDVVAYREVRYED